ncbi:hypothetical protein [Fusibacter sp. 3D3]|uniref:hypothetical protein n=1 Tax=Fusibacter sp. 3D3 TaxID=1048380 RepID=UPI000853B831|nr:hypothetical protein [Fusibacter sp. 3D3]GAU78662.1 hypothetical protein F3D3_3297 [Fusibacter sp. 3D3]
MKKELQTKVAKDLNINKFQNETENEYNQRLLYSAASLWVKTLIHGSSVKDIKHENMIVYPDIMYVQGHLSKVIKAYIRCLEMNLDWIEYQYSDIDEVAMDIARTVMKEMIYTNNIAEIKSRKMAMVPLQYYSYNDWIQMRGAMNFDKEVISLGVSQWMQAISTKNVIEEQRVVNVKGNRYYELIVKNFIWKKASLKASYKIFKEGSVKKYSKCWIPYVREKVTDGIHIIKEVSEFNGGYILVKHDDENVQMSVLDPWYTESYEIYRILYALNVHNGTRAQFKVKDKEEYKILYYASALPAYENKIILSLSWPYSYYGDKYARIIPNFIWHVAEGLLRDLGVDIIFF